MQTISTKFYGPVRRFLNDAGYSDEVITQGFQYADSIGWSDKDTLGQMALSRILYSDSQLEDGERVGWTPVDWIFSYPSV